MDIAGSSKSCASWCSASLRTTRHAFFVFFLFVSHATYFHSSKKFVSCSYRAGKRCSAYSWAPTASSAHLLSLRLAVGFAFVPSALRSPHVSRATASLFSFGKIGALHLVGRTACPHGFHSFLFGVRSAPAWFQRLSFLLSALGSSILSPLAPADRSGVRLRAPPVVVLSVLRLEIFVLVPLEFEKT